MKRLKKAPAPMPTLEGLDLEFSLNRCPYCHTDVGLKREDWVACRKCLARHHSECWSEGKRCSACGCEVSLSTDLGRSPSTRLRVLRLIVATSAIACSLLLLHSLNSPGVPLYQGRSLEAWASDLGSDDRETCNRAVSVFGEIAEPAISTLLVALNHERSEIRQNAARALGEIGPAARASVPALAVALKGDTGDVRSSAARALSRMGSRAVKPLSEALRDDADPAVRQVAAWALGTIEPPAEQAAFPLERALAKDPHSTVRLIAANSLGYVAAAAEVPVTVDHAEHALRKALGDPDESVREQAQDALVRIGR